MNNTHPGASLRLRTGWASTLARITMATLLFEAVSGLAITLSPFHSAVQWSVILHTIVGAVTLMPLAWYCGAHILDYRRYAFSHVVLLGYLALLGLIVCSVSGVVVTWQGLFGIRTTAFWRQTHLISTLVTLVAVVPHLLSALWRAAKSEVFPAARVYFVRTVMVAGLALLGTAALTFIYSGARYENQFPPDYSFLYGTNRPFAPSLARTDTGGAFDARSLAGSKSCGTAGCHERSFREFRK
jgi:hypothetical protein